MSRTKQINRKQSKGTGGKKQGSKTKIADNNIANVCHRKNINCNKLFDTFKFERPQTCEPLLPRVTIARCFSPFLRTNGQSDVLIGSYIHITQKTKHCSAQHLLFYF